MHETVLTFQQSVAGERFDGGTCTVWCGVFFWLTVQRVACVCDG